MLLLQWTRCPILIPPKINHYWKKLFHQDQMIFMFLFFQIPSNWYVCVNCRGWINVILYFCIALWAEYFRSLLNPLICFCKITLKQYTVQTAVGQHIILRSQKSHAQCVFQVVGFTAYPLSKNGLDSISKAFFKKHKSLVNSQYTNSRQVSVSCTWQYYQSCFWCEHFYNDL